MLTKKLQMQLEFTTKIKKLINLLLTKKYKKYE